MRIARCPLESRPLKSKVRPLKMKLAWPGKLDFARTRPWPISACPHASSASCELAGSILAALHSGSPRVLNLAARWIASWISVKAGGLRFFRGLTRPSIRIPTGALLERGRIRGKILLSKKMMALGVATTSASPEVVQVAARAARQSSTKDPPRTRESDKTSRIQPAIVEVEADDDGICSLCFPHELVRHRLHAALALRAEAAAHLPKQAVAILRVSKPPRQASAIGGGTRYRRQAADHPFEASGGAQDCRCRLLQVPPSHLVFDPLQHPGVCSVRRLADRLDTFHTVSAGP